jgi:hypothetical protein
MEGYRPCAHRVYEDPVQLVEGEKVEQTGGLSVGTQVKNKWQLYTAMFRRRHMSR